MNNLIFLKIENKISIFQKSVIHNYFLLKFNRMREFNFRPVERMMVEGTYFSYELVDNILIKRVWV